MTEMVFETLTQYGHLTGLTAREDYIKDRNELPDTNTKGQFWEQP